MAASSTPHTQIHNTGQHDAKSTQKPPAHSLCPEAVIITDLALHTVVFVCMGVHIVMCACMCVCVDDAIEADCLLLVIIPCAVLRLVTQSCSTFCDPMDSSLPGSSVHGILQARILEWIAMPSSRGSSQPRDQTQVSHVAVTSLPSEPPGKPKNTRVGNPSLLQRIFPTQESNRALLRCRWILYQRSYLGSPHHSLEGPK